MRLVRLRQHDLQHVDLPSRRRPASAGAGCGGQCPIQSAAVDDAALRRPPVDLEVQQRTPASRTISAASTAAGPLDRQRTQPLAATHHMRVEPAGRVVHERAPVDAAQWGSHTDGILSAGQQLPPRATRDRSARRSGCACPEEQARRIAVWCRPAPSTAVEIEPSPPPTAEGGSPFPQRTDASAARFRPAPPLKTRLTPARSNRSRTVSSQPRL